MKYCFILFQLIVLPFVLLAQRVNIIPEPLHITELKGSFVFNKQTHICVNDADDNLTEIVELFAGKLQRLLGYTLPVRKKCTDDANSISIHMEKSASTEAYSLAIKENSIHITASAAGGVVYALQTLLQLLPVEAVKGRAPVNGVQGIDSIPCAIIEDAPLYSYRGMHLDVSRHFFPASYIKRYLDILASFKINVFHWHLTDSHGWRLQINKYPRLTSVGAWRADRHGIPMTLAKPTAPGELADYGGFYTQDQVKDIIHYAKLLNIEIIPEIEMPGHCTAALVAYPQFSDLDNSTPLLMPCGYKGDLMHNFCAGYDSTYIFLQDILKEVMALFPSPYVHIGGDEVRPAPWLSCSRCKQRMQTAGLKNISELQSYFTHRIDSFITANGKRMIGWDEILGADISDRSVAMSWHGDSKAVEAAAKGNEVIMTPYWYTYFDFYQSAPALEEQITYARLSLDSVYAFNPMPKQFDADRARYIKGGEACLWTENISTPERVEYMLLPRLAALSEALWTPLTRKNYPRFVSKLEEQFKRFDAEGINYAKSMYNVDIIPTYDSVLRTIKVRLTDQTYKYPLYYTLDGTTPSLNSMRYTGPVLINKSSIIKAASFKDRKIAGKVNTDSFAVHKALGSVLHLNTATERASRLCDGIYGTVEPYDARWVLMTDSLVTLDLTLSELKPVTTISLRFMEDEVGFIYRPAAITISASVEGQKYRTVYHVVNNKVPGKEERNVVKYTANMKGKIKHIKIVITNANLNAAKAKNILLLDEIVIQ